jgi:hypothetical protein
MWIYDSKFKHVVGGFHGVANALFNPENASYVDRLRKIPKINHIVCSVMMGQGLNRLRTDTQLTKA